MTAKSPNIQTYAEAYERDKARIEAGYLQLLRFKSISTDPAFKGDVEACADFLEKYLKDMGLTVERWPTSGHPTLFATYDKAGPNLPTVLIYNHYDVQPVDPLEEWENPPFEPTIKGKEVFARGAQDNKGQLWYVLQAIKGFLDRDGSLPVNLKLCIEGEEECGSAGLAGILDQRKQQLRADHLVVADMGIYAPDHPSITLGIRGLCTMGVTFRGSKVDLHSGTHGGIVYNPNHALVEVLAKLRNSEGRVAVPGFYDNVQPFSEEEMAALDFDFNQKAFEDLFGTKATGGEEGVNFMQRGSIRPTLEINGISGGYAGPGFKTVIPAKAEARISCRLVPNQDPEKIQKLVADYLVSLAPPGIEVEVDLHKGMGRAVAESPVSTVANAFSQAYTEVFDKPCSRILSGGSIPIIASMAKVAKAEVVLLGVALPDDNIHAPNEHFGLDRLKQGYLVMTRGLALLGK